MKTFTIFLFCILTASLAQGAEEHITCSFHHFTHWKTPVFSKNKTFYVTADNDTNRWINSTIDGSHPFGMRPKNFPMNFDDSDSTFWFFTLTPNQFNTGTIARVDKVRLNGDTIFTYQMADTMVENSLILDCDRPVIASRPDGYTLELFDVYEKKKINTYRMKSPEPWDKISAYSIATNLSEVYIYYQFNGNTYNIATGDSLASKNTIKEYSKDKKYFFMNEDGRFLVFRSSDSSLYYAWADTNLKGKIQYLQDPEKIFVGGIILNYLDTNNLPDYANKIDGVIFFYNGQEYIINSSADTLRKIDYKSKRIRDFYGEILFFSFNGDYLFLANSISELYAVFSSTGALFSSALNNRINISLNRPTGTTALLANEYDKYYIVDYMQNKVIRNFTSKVEYFADGACSKLFYRAKSPSRINIEDATSGIVVDSFPVSCVYIQSISPDGKYCLMEVSTTTNNRFILYSTSIANWDVYDSLKIEANKKGLTFSPDSRMLAATDSSDTLRIYDTQTKSLSRVHRLRSCNPSGLDVSADGKHIVYGTRNGEIIIINAETGAEEAVLYGMLGETPEQIMISPNMKYIVAYGSNYSIMNWAIDFGFISVTEPSYRSHEIEYLLASPNPFTDEARVNFVVEQAGRVSIVVRNTMGEQVATREYFSQSGEQTFSLSGAGLAAGIYFCDITAAGKTYRAKAVLVR